MGDCGLFCADHGGERRVGRLDRLAHRDAGDPDRPVDLDRVGERAPGVLFGARPPRVADVAQHHRPADRQREEVDAQPALRLDQPRHLAGETLAMVEHPQEMREQHRAREPRQDVGQGPADQRGRRPFEQIGGRRIDPRDAAGAVDEDHRVADRLDQRRLRCRHRVAPFRLPPAVEAAIVGEGDQHMRILAVMRDHDRLARRLQAPVRETANEFGSGHALRFPDRLHIRLPGSSLSLALWHAGAAFASKPDAKMRIRVRNGTGSVLTPAGSVRNAAR